MTPWPYQLCHEFLAKSLVINIFLKKCTTIVIFNWNLKRKNRNWLNTLRRFKILKQFFEFNQKRKKKNKNTKTINLFLFALRECILSYQQLVVVPGIHYQLSTERRLVNRKKVFSFQVKTHFHFRNSLMLFTFPVISRWCWFSVLKVWNPYLCK